MEGGYGTPPELSDSDIKKILERQNKPTTPEAMAALRTEMKKSTESLRGEKTVFTQTHENISVNKKFSPADFAR